MGKSVLRSVTEQREHGERGVRDIPGEIRSRMTFGGIGMPNIIDYVIGESDDFAKSPFNAVDSLVLSQIAYLRFNEFVSGPSETWSPVSIGDLTDREDLDPLFFDVRDKKDNLKLLHALARSPRFRDVKLAFYVEKTDFEAEKQFSALTYLLGDGTAYTAYRGTDSTFVGWKEDFNMAFLSPVPAQVEGVRYLNAVAALIPSGLRVGGHSKGGNIAVYSAITCHRHVQDRIIQVFSHDGPGFTDEVFLSDGYANIKDRIHKTLPQSSVVGMLLQHQEEYTVVKSNRVGILQHDPFSWLVDGRDFLRVRSVGSGSKFMNETLNMWIASLDNEKRELFVDTLFRVVKSTNAATFYDLTDDWQVKAIAVANEVKGIDEETKRFVLKTIGSLFVLAMKNLRDIQLKDVSAIQRSFSES